MTHSVNKKDIYKQSNKQFMDHMRTQDGIKELRGNVLYKVLETGDGVRAPSPRNVVTCFYKGTTIDGKVFDNTFNQSCPAAFRVNQLISGFQIALVNMHIGDHWIVYIPSEMGYGSRGAGSDIPGDSTLIFEIKLVGIV